jgi:hypothetical protein
MPAAQTRARSWLRSRVNSELAASRLGLPQVTIVGEALNRVMMVRSLGMTEVHPRLSGDDVLYRRSDIF